MRIGFLLNTCEPFYRGGYERRAWSFARELARQGHDVRIYTSCERDEIIEGVRFVRLAPLREFFNARGVRNGRADLLFALATLRLLGKLKRGELDVLDVCATPFLHLPFVALVARMKKIPAVLTCHEALLAALPDYVRERGNGRTGAGFLVQLLALIYRLGMGLFPRRIAVSRRTAQALSTECFPSFATVEYGLEAEAMSPNPPQLRPETEPVRLVSCGRLTPIKNVDQALAVLLSLRSATARAFHFDIIGAGSERLHLERMVDEARARDVVTFHGEVSETEKGTLLARSDVFILSSPREGFSIATLEAMAQGCAALVVSDPAHPNGALDFVCAGSEGLIVGPGVDAMREGLRRLVEDGAGRESSRRAAWETARNYSIKPQTMQLIAAYREAIATPAV